ncbi:MAG: CotH kinase family protein [Verrucomicrobiota bacterium]
MKRKMSKLAVASTGLALLALLLALTRALPLPIIAIPVSIVAVCLGGISIGTIQRHRARLRGMGLAVAGLILGLMTMATSGVVIVSTFAREMENRARWQNERHAAMRNDADRAREAMPDEAAADFSSNLPIVVLQTDGRGGSKHARTRVRTRIFEPHEGRAALQAAPDHDGWGTINLRGHTSMQLPKQSYTFHTTDAQGKQIKVPLLGLPAEEDWVLYAPFEDKSLMRDVLAYELCHRMGRYAPRTRYFELFLTEADRAVSMRDYAGVYVLIEKIKRGADRVHIAKLDPTHRAEPEISGGYIIKRDHQEDDGERFHTDHGGPFFYVYPKPKNITSEQRAWLRKYWNHFEAALYGSDFADPNRGYAAYLDVDAFIDQHWLNELGKNVDAFRYSAFLTKDRGGKIQPGPPWDWNRSFGNANYYGGGQTHGWYWQRLRPNEISWYVRLREDPVFVQRCTSRWLALRQEVFDPARIHARIDELAALLQEPQERNFKRWPILGQHVTSNFYVGQTFEDEVNWLKSWIDRRIAWIDSQIAAPSE